MCSLLLVGRLLVGRLLVSRQMTVWLWHAQQPAPARACRFYAGEMVMSMLALTAALYGVAAAHKWSFSVFLGLQGELHFCGSSCHWHLLCSPWTHQLLPESCT